MRIVLVALLVGLCAMSGATPYPKKHHFGVENLEQKQRDIWTLFRYVNQPNSYQPHMDIASSFDYEHHADYYTKPEVHEHFLQYLRYGMLRKGEVFSVYDEEHAEQAQALFKVFYYAKDYDTFYKTAVWARHHTNEGLYLYALSVAIVHRPDTYYVVLPPIFEVYPHYFYGSEVIQQAQYYKQVHYGAHQGQQYSHKDNIVRANYTGHYVNVHPEQALAYFTEDVGVNAFYYYYNVYYPYWMSAEEFRWQNDHQGEFFYYIHQQILARYYLERLSNGFGEVAHFDWDVPFPVGYYPSLTYPNGLEFPTRPHYANLHEYFYNYGQKWSWKGLAGYSHTFVHDYEHRIRDAIDRGYVYTKDGRQVDIFSEEGFDVLGSAVHAYPESQYFRYYGAYEIFARHLLGYSYQPLDYHKAYPSALEHFETSLRDPAFYMLYKKLILHFQKYKYYLKPYTKEELHFNGVEVNKMEVDKLVTYFEDFQADITNAVYVTDEEAQQDAVKVKVVQKRLTHKPFQFKIHVNSAKEVDAVVKVFLGPKYDEYGRPIAINENRVNFVQFDHFVYKLKAGENTIVKNSKEIYNYMHDRTPYYELYQQVFGVYNKQHKQFQFYDEQIWFGFPQRLMLPKGSYEGTPYQFYVIVCPYVAHNVRHEHEQGQYPIAGYGHQYVSGYAMGYPFDRHIQFEKLFHQVPNSYFYETQVYHRDYDTINVTH